MKTNFFFSIVIALSVSVLVHVFWPQSVSTGSQSVSFKKEESALERIKRTDTIRCGYVGWPPFYDLDPNTKQLSGFFKDTTDAVMSLTGWKIDYVPVVGGSEVQDLNAGKIDAMCGTGPWYLNSIKEVNYTRPLGYAAGYLYGRADETRFAAMADLNKPEIVLAGIDGDISVELAQRFYPQAKMQALPGTTDAAQMLLNVTTRKADAVITDPITVAGFNKSNAEKVKRLFPDPVAVYGMEFSVKKGETELLETLNTYSDMAINMNMIDPVVKKYDPEGTLFLQAVKAYK